MYFNPGVPEAAYGYTDGVLQILTKEGWGVGQALTALY